MCERELPCAELLSRLRENASSPGQWQEEGDCFIWVSGDGCRLHVHDGGEGRWMALISCGDGEILGLGRLKQYCQEEGVRLPARLKRVNAQGCAFWHAGQLVVYPAAFLPRLEKALRNIL